MQEDGQQAAGLAPIGLDYYGRPEALAKWQRSFVLVISARRGDVDTSKAVVWLEMSERPPASAQLVGEKASEAGTGLIRRVGSMTI